MIEFNFEVSPKDIETKLVQVTKYGFGPSSNLIDKFGKFYLLFTNDNKSIDHDSKTEIIFYSGENAWPTALVSTRELIINNRWSTIDRAMVLACGLNRNLDKNTITKVMIRIPQILNKDGYIDYLT